jgi:hypothetical protein
MSSLEDAAEATKSEGWSSKDAEANHASRDSHRRRRPCFARPLERPASPVATAEAYRASCNCRHHWAWGAPPPLVRFESTIVAFPPASGASSPLGPGRAPLPAAFLELSSPLAPRIVVARMPKGTAAKI